MFPSFPRLAIAVVLTLSGLRSASAADDKLLVDFSKPADLARITATGASDDAPKPVTTEVVKGSHGKALAVKLATTGIGSPGIALRAETEGGATDLSAFARVEAEVTNTGSAPITVVVRVDNDDDWQRNPWSSNGTTIQPGQSETITVPFGTNWGNKTEYAFNPAKVNQIMIFMANPEAGSSFRLEALRAAGKAGK